MSGAWLRTNNILLYSLSTVVKHLVLAVENEDNHLVTTS